jgi:hypothetical protein
MRKNKSFFTGIAGIILLLFVTGGCDKYGEQSSEKQVLSFKFETTTPAVTAIVDQTLLTITATVPVGSNLSSLVPTISVSKGATVSPASGVAQNFTLPVVYTVTAEDGTVAAYVANITIDGSGDPETLSGTMSANRTLVNRNNSIDYIISEPLFLDGNALLTVEPGVTIAFTSVSNYINVGENAGLKMVGTASDPIILTGPVNNPNKGSWNGIFYYSDRADNIMEYVEIRNAGSDDDNGAIYIGSEASLAVRHTLLYGSVGYGFEVNGEFREFTNNTVRDCEKAPVIAYDIKRVEAMDATSTFTNNKQNYMWVSWGTADEVLNIHKLTIPYFLDGGLYTEKSVTLQAGVQLIFNSTTSFSIYETSKLIAEGTSADPILISCVEKEPGAWSGIYMRSSLSNVMSYCTVEYGGYGNDGNNVDCNGKLTISNCTIRNSSNYGFIVYDTSEITASNVVFNNCAGGNVYNWDTGEVSDNL